MNEARPLRSGLILAGGLSSRMGRDKGLLELRGQPLVLWVVERMRTVVDEIAVSTSSTNNAAYREVLPSDVACVSDTALQMGPLGGWLSGLPALRGEYVAVAPCDGPLYSALLAHRLFELAQDHDGAVPRLQRFFEPLHAVYHREHLLEAVKKTLAMGLDRPVHTYAHLDIVQVDEPTIRAVDPELDSFQTANTPEEFEKVKRRVETLGLQGPSTPGAPGPLP